MYGCEISIRNLADTLYIIMLIKVGCITVAPGNSNHCLLVCICIFVSYQKTVLPLKHIKMNLIIIMHILIVAYALITNMLITDI